MTEDTFRIYRIRRLRCPKCGKIHHELPDCIVPYKRFSAELMTQVIEQPENQVVNGTTIKRIHYWFNHHLTGFIASTRTVRSKYLLIAETPFPGGVFSKLDRLKILYDHHPRWLSHLVKTLTNLNLWPHTRSVSMSN